MKSHTIFEYNHLRISFLRRVGTTVPTNSLTMVGNAFAFAHPTIFIVILTLSLLFPAQIQAEEVSATVNRTQLRLGESLELKITVSGEEGNVDLSPIQDFKIISRGTATSINMINGQFSRETAYTYTLIPLKEGSLTIPSLPVNSGSRTWHTKPVSILVSKTDPSENSTKADQDVFAQAQVSENSPFAGQQIVYTIKVYQAAEIANANLQAPDFSGFSAKKVEEPKQYRTVVNGREFHVTALTYVLIPVKPGEITIGPAVLHCDIVRRSGRRRSFFDDPFLGGRLESAVFQTEPISLNIRALPQYQGTGKFSGLVGKFSIHTAIDPAAIKVGESATLSLVISGTGNIMDAGQPEIAIPQSFKTYNDNPEDAIQVTEQGYSGQKSFRTALVPSEPGEYDIGAVQLVYFDTEKGEYAETAAHALHMSVAPSNEKPDDMNAVSPTLPEKPSFKKKVEFTGRDILPLKEDMEVLKTQKSMSAMLFFLFLAAPVSVFVMAKTVIVMTGKKQEIPQMMARRAQNALKDAERAVSDPEKFLSFIYRAVISAIHAKAGTAGESLTYAEAAEILRSKGFAEETARNASGLLEKIESAKFSGLMTKTDFAQELLKETKDLFKIIDR
ncbi:MAG: BatD family protein [Desulfococcaceae bacterium]